MRQLVLPAAMLLVAAGAAAAMGEDEPRYLGLTRADLSFWDRAGMNGADSGTRCDHEEDCCHNDRSCANEAACTAR